MLTLQNLKDLSPGSIIATGVVPNSPNGVYMTDTNKGRELLWVAKRGNIPDWTIYIHWEDSGFEFVLTNGDKVHDYKNIKKLVPCDDEAFKMYRY